MIICGIYKYTSPSGKTYIGSSKNIYKRIKYYKSLNCKNQKNFITLLKNTGVLINADVNGSLNILRKVVGNFNYDPIEVCSTPAVITVKFN